MKKIVLVFYGIMIISVVLLSGCTESEEEAITDTKAVAESLFKENSVETNKELNNFSLYLPDDFEIVEESNYNLILEEEDQTFLLFYNTLEDSHSEVNYQAAQATEGYILLESFEDENRFGYIGIRTTEEETYELQVGVGGVKITTLTSKENLEQNGEEMMKMALSIAYTSND